MKAVQRSVSNRQPAPKESKKKKTLKEVAGTMLGDMVEKARQERMRPILELQRAQEDEIAILTFGPGWRGSNDVEADPVEPVPELPKSAAE